ncbi:hypothetical protein IFR04_005389 [Cadophora malorum]|uniref:Uncharacterized protein n=1 Tax=Cadophora malorum TaxID=108018 RepID=A0A8H7WBJ6_9HELO|nr:hypothetical protein IFR04_005389 [Cadophora malorum]
MKLSLCIFMLWAAITLSYVIPGAEPTKLLSLRHSEDKTSSPPPYTLHSPSALLRDRAASTKTIQNRQETTTSTPTKSSGSQKFSVPQIFAISFASVMGATVLGFLPEAKDRRQNYIATMKINCQILHIFLVVSFIASSTLCAPLLSIESQDSAMVERILPSLESVSSNFQSDERNTGVTVAKGFLDFLGNRLLRASRKKYELGLEFHSE